MPADVSEYNRWAHEKQFFTTNPEKYYNLGILRIDRIGELNERQRIFMDMKDFRYGCDARRTGNNWGTGPHWRKKWFTIFSRCRVTD